MLGIISLARIEKYKLHALLQVVLYIVSVLVLTFFEIGVRFVGGYEAFIEGSGAGHNYVFFVLVFHITISVITLIIWTSTLLLAKKQLRYNKHKKKHKLFGWLTFLGVVLVVLTGAWVYMLLFVY